MPPQLSRITSFNLDLEDWYSCHTSDDEAYQDALERNSNASFYTARGRASTAGSIVNTSIAIGSPSRLADADQALAEMVPEPIGDLRMQREPPELDEEDAPLIKRTRSIRTGPVPSAISPTRSSTPSTKTKAGFKSLFRRGAPFRPVGTTTSAPFIPTVRPATLATPAAGSLRVCISVVSSGVSVRLHVLPDIFCFGDVPLPGVPDATTDYSAVLLGNMGNSPASSKADQTPLQPTADTVDDDPATPKVEEIAKLDVDCAVSLVTRPRGMTPFKGDDKFNSYCGNIDPATPKDQTKASRQAGANERERKAGGGFPGAGLFQRLFSGLRHSRASSTSNEGSLAPATVRELGSELLIASAAATVAELASAVQAVPVIAGYVQAAVPAAAVPADPVAAAALPVNAAPPAGGALDEAAAAAQRLSAEIFRNVLRTSAGGASGPSNPKTVLSPRDTAFPAAEQRHLQRDQMATISAATPARSSEEPKSASRLRSPGDGLQQSPSGAAALALLVGLAADGVESLAPVAAEDVASADAVPCRIAGAGGVKVAPAGQLAPNLSVEGLDCGGLPMPELEQCESPVTVNAQHAVAAASTSDVPDGIAVASVDVSNEQGPAGDFVEEAGTPVKAVTAVEALAAAEVSPEVASPRTVSKRAYGTVARLVKKMAPDFSVSASAMQVSVCAPVVSAGEATELTQPSAEGPALVTDAAAACLVTVPVAGTAEPAVKSGGDAQEVVTATAVEHEEPLISADPVGGSEASSSGPEPSSDKDSEPSDGAGQANPKLFVFGQEQPKTAKHAKARSLTKKSAAPLSCDDTAETPAEAAGRKRKGGDEILPNAKVPVTAERTSSDASQDIDSIPAPQPPAEAQAKLSTPGPSCDVTAGADLVPVECATEAKQIDASSDLPHALAESDTAVLGADAVPRDRVTATENPAHATPVLGATATMPASSDPAAEPSSASAPAVQDVAVVEEVVGAHADSAADAAVVSLADPNTSPAAKAAGNSERRPTPEAPVQVDSKHSPTAMQKHDGLAGTTGAGATPVAGSASKPDATEAQAGPVRSCGAAMTVPSPDLKGESAGARPMPPAAHVASDAVTDRASAAPTSVAAAGPAMEVASKPAASQRVEGDLPAVQTSQPTESSVVHEAPTVAPGGQEIQAASGAPVQSALVPDVSDPAAAASTAVKTPPAETQTSTKATPTGEQQQKPAEGGKHKRRGSFALFSCFRA